MRDAFCRTVTKLGVAATAVIALVVGAQLVPVPRTSPAIQADVAAPTPIDAQHATAWLHRQIVFDREPLKRIAAEFNRYAQKPIEITTPDLQDLEVSGVVSTDDPEEILAFLRSLEGVRVEVTATEIRVFRK